MTFTCPKCGEPVRPHLDRCIVCRTDVGAPNVRAADAAAERLALNQRYGDALANAGARGCTSVATALENRLEASEAVLSRSWAVAKQLLEGDNELYGTFYLQLRANVRLPENNEYDRWRRSADDTFFPEYFEQIRFAALSTTGLGPLEFGDCSISLKQEAIENRASVFEENTYFFWKRRLAQGEEPPPGFRATWQNRSRLGVAKLAQFLKPRMKADDLDRLILKRGSRGMPDDFIEVHIYGPIHRRAVSKISGKEPRRRADQVLVADLKSKLRQANIEVSIK